MNQVRTCTDLCGRRTANRLLIGIRWERFQRCWRMQPTVRVRRPDPAECGPILFNQPTGLQLAAIWQSKSPSMRDGNIGKTCFALWTPTLEYRYATSRTPGLADSLRMDIGWCTTTKTAGRCMSHPFPGQVRGSRCLPAAGTIRAGGATEKSCSM